MGQHALKAEDGAVALEFILVVPLLLSILVFVLECEKVLRGSWTSLATARIGIWAVQRMPTMPAAASLAEVLLPMDARIEHLGLQPVSPSGAIASAVDELDELADGLAAISLVAARPAPAPANGVETTADLGIGWGKSESRCFMNAQTWKARDTKLSSESFGSLGSTWSASALHRIRSQGRRAQ